MICSRKNWAEAPGCRLHNARHPLHPCYRYEGNTPINIMLPGCFSMGIERACEPGSLFWFIRDDGITGARNPYFHKAQKNLHYGPTMYGPFTRHRNVYDRQLQRHDEQPV